MRQLVALGVVLVGLGGTVSAAPGDVSLAKPMLVSPQMQLGDAGLQAKYDDVWKTYQDKVEKGTATVVSEITRLYEDAKSAGNLDLAIFWSEMKKTLADKGHLSWEPIQQKREWRKRFGDADFPDDLTAVIRKCETAFVEAKAGLEAGYKQLEVDLTKADKLQEALAVRKEFNALWGAGGPPAPPKPKSPAEKLGLNGKADYELRTRMLTVRYDGGSRDELDDFELSAGKGSAVVRDGLITIQANATITHAVDFESVTLAGSIIVPTSGPKKGAIRFGVSADQKVFAYGNMSVRTPDAWKDLGGLQWDRPTPFRLYFGQPSITIETQGRQASIPCELLTVGRPVIGGADLGVALTELTISGKVSERVAKSLAE